MAQRRPEKSLQDLRLLRVRFSPFPTPSVQIFGRLVRVIILFRLVPRLCSGLVSCESQRILGIGAVGVSFHRMTMLPPFAQRRRRDQQALHRAANQGEKIRPLTNSGSRWGSLTKADP